MIPQNLKQAIKYILNSGWLNAITKTKSCLISNFDEDFEPIGPTLRNQLVNEGFAVERDNMFLCLTNTEKYLKNYL